MGGGWHGAGGVWWPAGLGGKLPSSFSQALFWSQRVGWGKGAWGRGCGSPFCLYCFTSTPEAGKVAEVPTGPEIR